MNDPRYLAVRFEPNGPACLGRVFDAEPDRFYWGCYEMRPNTWRDLGSAKILHEYDWVDPSDDEGLEAMDIAHTRRFHQKKPAIISELQDKSAGWLGPGGNFYPCHYNGHDSLADILLAQIYERTGNAPEELERRGWWRIDESGVVVAAVRRPHVYTQAQLDTMFDLSNADGLCESYRRAMRQNARLAE